MKYHLALVAALSLYATPSNAHVTANPDNGTAGQYFQTSFRISHGCEGSDTVAVRIRIPSGFVSLRPQYKPGWTVQVKKRKLEKPLPAGHGKMADEEFAEVSWTGGVLPDSQYDEFGLLMKLPDGASGTLWFPVIQECKDGRMEWTGIPGRDQEWHDLDHPAPFVKITDKPSSHSHHQH